MVLLSARCLQGFACLCLPALARANSSPPSTDKDIICSTTDPSDCYPRILVPTKDFQPIKENQDIPPGLHVRLNIYTGEREARLNIPMEGESDFSLDGLPTEQSIVIVEQPEPESAPEPIQEKPALRDQVPLNPPVYDTAGKIPPPPPEAGGEFGTFQKAMLAIQMEASVFDSALDDLLELSHDIYYGVEIAKDGPVLEKLVCLTLGLGLEKMPAQENGRDHKAASILGYALQNNPTALKEVGDFWNLVMFPTCAPDPMSGKPSVKGDFVSTLRSRIDSETEPAALKAKITAISGLLREGKIRASFLDKSGMEYLLAIFLKKGEEWDIVREKLGQLVMDNFLDEGMGAQLGVWPKMPVSEVKVCEVKGRMLEDGCWEYHIEAYLKTTKDESWAQNFLVALKQQREKWGDSIKDREL